MPDQATHTVTAHTPVSNEPKDLTQGAVVEQQQVSQPPSEGAGFAGLQVQEDKSKEQRAEGLEAVPGYKPLRASLSEALTDPNIVLPAPDTTVLRPIAEATFGPLAVPETVHDGDDRIQIADTSMYPWRAYASLLITAADSSQYIGTGWFIGPRTLITAGHCVFIHAPGRPAHGWVRSIQVMPGRNGSALPFGSATSTDFRSVGGWTNNQDENYDYGAIIIPTELGNAVGWFGFGVYPDNELLASTANIGGYPGDKPSGTQWFFARQVASVKPMKVFYDIDTAGGQSGSAVFRLVNGDRYAIAVHAYGGPTTNSGTRITQEVYDNLLAWRV
jgi:glutamyl endopeptidase